MAAAFDAISSAEAADDSPSSLAWTHTPVGSPGFVVVHALTRGTGNVVTSITYGATSLSIITTAQDSSSLHTELWGAATALTGAQTITINYTSASFSIGMGVTATGGGSSGAKNSAQASNQTTISTSLAPIW